jgi:tripartite-type tricarboxylate transporter receptor subunit TctC
MSDGWVRAARAISVAFVWAAATLVAQAQSYPSRPVKMIVPFPPGGPTDISARIVAAKMGEDLGQPIVVENRAGATGMLGSALVATAPPDGYLIVMGTIGSHVQAPLMAAQSRYDARKDFTPVSLLATAPLVLMVNPDLKVQSVPELVSLMKTAPGKEAYSSSGVGSPLHLAGALFESSTGTKGLHVAYKGSAPALQAVMAGEVAFLFDVVSSALPFVSSGKTRGLAVTGRKRVSSMSSLPTLKELGIPLEAYTWNALFAPPGTPADVVAKLQRAAVKAVKDPQIAAKLAELGLDPVGSTPAELTSLLNEEMAKWGAVIATSGLKGSN